MRQQGGLSRTRGSASGGGPRVFPMPMEMVVVSTLALAAGTRTWPDWGIETRQSPSGRWRRRIGRGNLTRDADGGDADFKHRRSRVGRAFLCATARPSLHLHLLAGLKEKRGIRLAPGPGGVRPFRTLLVPGGSSTTNNGPTARPRTTRTALRLGAAPGAVSKHLPFSREAGGALPLDCFKVAAPAMDSPNDDGSRASSSAGLCRGGFPRPRPGYLALHLSPEENWIVL